MVFAKLFQKSMSMLNQRTNLEVFPVQVVNYVPQNIGMYVDKENSSEDLLNWQFVVGVNTPCQSTTKCNHIIKPGAPVRQLKVNYHNMQ